MSQADFFYKRINSRQNRPSDRGLRRGRGQSGEKEALQ